MLASLLVLALHAAPCEVPEVVTLNVREGATVEVVSQWVRRTFCVAVNVDPAVKKGAALKVGLSGSASWNVAWALVSDAFAASGLELSRTTEGATIRIAPEPSVTQQLCDGALRGVRAVSATERRVSRAAWESDWSSCALTQARAIPAMKDGRVYGVRLFSIRAESLWAAVGFHNGDTVIDVNGLPMNDPDEIPRHVKKLRAEQRVDISLERRGEPLHLILTVEP